MKNAPGRLLLYWDYELQVGADRSRLGVMQWGREDHRQTEILLDLLDAYGVKSTFAVLGFAAQEGEIPYHAPAKGLRSWVYANIGILDVDAWIWYWHYRKHIFPILQSIQPARILDAGCGTGLWSFYLARQYPRCQVIGIDILEEAVAFCTRSKHASRLDNVEFSSMPFLEMTYHQEFDIILSSFSLHYSYQSDVAILERFARALKPGGCLFLAVPAALSLWNPGAAKRLPASQQEQKYGITVDAKELISHYYSAELTSKLIEAGFDAHQIHHMVGRTGQFAKKLYASSMRNAFFQIAAWPLAFILGWLDSLTSPGQGMALLVLAWTKKI
jgi:SAM-dependent methyltransferase